MTTERAAAIRQALGELAAALASANATTSEIEEMCEAISRKLQEQLRVLKASEENVS